MKSDISKDNWEESYQRKENFIFYPKEEVVKFLNRFVRKKLGIDEFKDILNFSNGIRGFDYGCGIGRQTILMREFGIEAYGVDISSLAIEIAKKLAIHLKYPDVAERFRIVEGRSIPFNDNFFDVTISESVLDSMYFETAKRMIREIDRVTKRLAFISLIFWDDSQHYGEFNGEEVVKTQHEKGTIQSYYNWSKINDLIKGTRFFIKWCNLVVAQSISSSEKSARYYIVLDKRS